MRATAVTFRVPHVPLAYSLPLNSKASLVYALTPRRDMVDSRAFVVLSSLLTVQAASNGLRVVLVATQAEGVKQRISAMLGPDLVESKRPADWALKTGGRVTLVKPPAIEDAPVESCDVVVIDQYDLLDQSVADWARVIAKQVILVGHPVSEEHPLFWAHQSGDAHRITYEDACKLNSNAMRKSAPERIQTAADRTTWYAEDPVKEDPPPFRIFARKRLKVRTKAGDIAQFRMWPDQCKYLAHKRLAKQVARAAGRPQTLILVLKSRRRGITTIEQGESYQIATTIPESRCLTLAQTDKDTRTIFGIARRFQRLDEEAPRMPGAGNSTVLNFPDLNSWFSLATAGATAPGRGDTLTKVHGSEVSRWCNRDPDRVAELMSGLTEAASHGSIILETTPAGKEWFYDQWMDSRRGANDWYRIFLRWFDDPSCVLPVEGEGRDEILDTLDDEEQHLIDLHGLTLPQIQWRRSAKRRLRVLFPQEYPEDEDTCFLAEGTTYFTAQVVIDRLKRLDRGAKVKEIRKPGGRGTLTRWQEPIPGVVYVLGADTSEGIPGCDPCGYIIKRKDTGEDVEALHGIFKPKDLAELCVDAHQRYNNCLMGVERENHGHAVIQRIQELGVKRRRYLFHYKDGRAGWTTSGETRPLMLESMADFLDGSPERINDELFLAECLSFKLQKNGRFEADKGAHDDAVIKHCIANKMRDVRTGGGVSTKRLGPDGEWVEDEED